MTKEIQKETEGALKDSGIDGLLKIIKNIISGFKPLISMISALTRMIGLILAPVAMVFTILLIPILRVIKPIIVAINRLFLPFMRLALQVMREGIEKKSKGDIKGFTNAMIEATGIVFSGLSIIVLTVNKIAIDFIMTLLTQIITLVLGLIFPRAQEGADYFLKAYNLISDSIYLSITDSIIQGTARMASEFGTSTTDFVDSANKAVIGILELHPDSMQAIISTNSQVLSDDMQKTIKLYFGEQASKESGGSKGTLGTLVDDRSKELGERGVAKINKIIDAANKKAAEIIENAKK
jgi:hypothetical protein